MVGINACTEINDTSEETPDIQFEDIVENDWAANTKVSVSTSVLTMICTMYLHMIASFIL